MCVDVKIRGADKLAGLVNKGLVSHDKCLVAYMIPVLKF